MPDRLNFKSYSHISKIVFFTYLHEGMVYVYNVKIQLLFQIERRKKGANSAKAKIRSLLQRPG